MTVRVVIADDQQLVRAGFRMILEREPDLEVVGEATDGGDAIRVSEATAADVVLMDIRMPGVDGIEATRQILRGPRGAAVRVLILTTFDLDEYVYDALHAGASGFLLKDAPPEQLTSAVRMIAAGDALLAPSITRRLIEQFVAPAPAARVIPPPALGTLSPRELEVFQLLARGRSNREIADALFVGETTVKTHVTRILAKLALRDRVQAVVLAYESGVITPRASDDTAQHS